MTWVLFLDDERDPFKTVKSTQWRETLVLPPLPEAAIKIWREDWVVARSFDDAVFFVETRGFPKFVFFDHDLGLGLNGYDFAKYLVELDMDTQTMPRDFAWYAHSANPIGRENINAYLTRYLLNKEWPTSSSSP